MQVLNALRSAVALGGTTMLVACGTAYSGASAPTVPTSQAKTVKVQHIRNATVKIDFSGITFLVDPMLSAKGEFPGFPNTYRSELRNPLVELPFSVADVMKSVEAVMVTHTHTDHWDDAAQRQISKNMPLFVQNETDAKTIRGQGFRDVRVLTGTTTFNGVTLNKTGGQRGTDLWFADPARAEGMGPVMGVVFSAPSAKTVYLAGDTVWRPEVDQALKQYKPAVVILNTGSALMSGFEEHPIIMGKQDTLQAAQAAPSAAIVAIHMDSVNHMSLSRKELRQFGQAPLPEERNL